MHRIEGKNFNWHCSYRKKNLDDSLACRASRKTQKSEIEKRYMPSSDYRCSWFCDNIIHLNFLIFPWAWFWPQVAVERIITFYYFDSGATCETTIIAHLFVVLNHKNFTSKNIILQFSATYAKIRKDEQNKIKKLSKN